jgi:hypothetical protein
MPRMPPFLLVSFAVTIFYYASGIGPDVPAVFSAACLLCSFNVFKQGFTCNLAFQYFAIGYRKSFLLRPSMAAKQA